MSTTSFSGALKQRSRKASAWLQALVIASAGLLPLLASQNVSAAQLASRSLEMSTTQGDATSVTYAFTFDLPSGHSGNVGSWDVTFCTTALGTCTTPTGFSSASATLVLDEINDVDSDWSDGTMTANTIQAARASAAAASAADTIELDFSGITNPTLSGATTSFYARMNLYSDNGYVTPIHDGTVVGAVTQQLVINGRVQERLEFCVAAIDDADATPADCSAFPTNFTIDIGIIDDAGVAASPVDDTGTNGANDDYGVVMVDTNATGSTVVSYFPEADDTGTNQLRNFRIDDSTTCNASEATFTDPCFQSAAAGGTDLSAAGERFGMQVACVDRTESENSTSALSNNVTAYYGDNNNTTCEDTEASDTYAWDNTGTAATIANGSGAINDEMLKLRFGARASATTPTGNYTVTTTFIATSTF